jgi:hypothetical protein
VQSESQGFRLLWFYGSDSAAQLNSMLCMFKVSSLAAVVMASNGWLDDKDCHIMEELGT